MYLLFYLILNYEENSVGCDVESEIENNDPNVLTAKFVQEELALGRKLGNHFQGGDVILDRSLKFQRDVNILLKLYEEV